MTTLRSLVLTSLSCGALLLTGCDSNQNWDDDDPEFADTGNSSAPPEVEWLAPEAGANLGGEDEIWLNIAVSDDVVSVEYRICRLDGDCSPGSDGHYYGQIDEVEPPDLAITLNEYYFPPSGTCVLFQANAYNYTVNYTAANIQVCF